MQLGPTSRLLILGLFAIAAGPGPEASAQQKRRMERAPARAFLFKSLGGGFLGVQVMGLTPELRTHFGAPEDRGVLVSKVEDDGPAAEAGVLVGDVVTAIEGKPIPGPHALLSAVRGRKAGESVQVEITRDGASMTLPVAIVERDRQVLDLAGMHVLPEIADFPLVQPFEGVRLDGEALEAFEDAMRELEDRFDSAEWQEKLKRFQELDLSKIQERMKEVEERLRKLESDLEGEGKKPGQD